MNERFNEIAAKIDRFPSPNPVELKVIHLCADPQTMVSTLVKTISADQSLTAKILRIANSNYFNYPRVVHSIDSAVVVLGLDLLKDAALSISMHHYYKQFKSLEHFDFQYLWHHSILTALVSRALAEQTDPAQRELYYVAGFLHDIGKWVESVTIPDNYHFLVEKSARERVRLFQNERKFLKFHHGEVGSYLIQKWNLPENLVIMLRYHHDLEAFSGDETQWQQIRLVYLGNLMAHYIQGNLKGLKALQQFDPNLRKYFTYTADELEKTAGHLRKVIQSHQVIFNIHQI
ncbi:MAG: HDOD domain-containing protein [Calditrichaeota bacterium]|nr:HDOD domain-containing protein [Calditrichota bacterium]MCB9089699.1 HDOD domain-containing protein [Calditrichia bacterium]